MERIFKKTKLRDIIFIILGTLLMAAAVNLVYDPLNMVTGGVTGFAIAIKDIVHRLSGFEIPVWLTNILVNIPLFIAAFIVLGKKGIKKTLFATAMFTLFIYVIPLYSMFQDDYLLAAIFGGVLGGVGIGLVLVTLSTTGGTDLLCMLIHKKIKYYSVPQLLIVVDGIIVGMGVLVFGLNRALYAIIAVYITAKVSDGILEGLKFAKMAYIISDKYQEIAQEILTKMDRGVTEFSVRGMYSDVDRKMLFCVVSKKEIVEIIDIVDKHDRRAFLIVSDVREVVGEGFRKR